MDFALMFLDSRVLGNSNLQKSYSAVFPDALTTLFVFFSLSFYSFVFTLREHFFRLKKMYSVTCVHSAFPNM